MIEFIRVTEKGDTLFSKSWELYISAFPEEERRPLEYHLETLNYKQFNSNAITKDGEFIGIIFWWELQNIIYIEHLATTTAVRGRGLGRTILEQFIHNSNQALYANNIKKGTILLEVEHPTENISQRRIEFYKRIGFKLNQHKYTHPSYWGAENPPVELMIMTHPHTISKTELDRFKRDNFAIIHSRHTQ